MFSVVSKQLKTTNSLQNKAWGRNTKHQSKTQWYRKDILIQKGCPFSSEPWTKAFAPLTTGLFPGRQLVCSFPQGWLLRHKPLCVSFPSISPFPFSVLSLGFTDHCFYDSVFEDEVHFPCALDLKPTHILRQHKLLVIFSPFSVFSLFFSTVYHL